MPLPLPLPRLLSVHLIPGGEGEGGYSLSVGQYKERSTFFTPASGI